MAEREQLKRQLEAAGCEIVAEDDKSIIATCSKIQLGNIPKDMKVEHQGEKNVKLVFNHDEE